MEKTFRKRNRSNPLYSVIWLIGILLFCAGCIAGIYPSNKPSSLITISPTAAQSRKTIIVTPFTQSTVLPAKTIMPTSLPALRTPPPPQNSTSIQSMRSPNTEWIAQASFEQPADKYHVQLKVFHNDGTKIWTIVDYWQSGLGYSYPQLHHWSNDSRYFYYSERWIADSPCEFFPIESSWKKVDVETGQVINFDLPLGRGHAISSDDTLIAYVSANAPSYLFLRDLKSGREQRVLLPAHKDETEQAEAGDIVWSPARDAVILTIANGNFCNTSKLEFSLVRANIPSLEINELIPISRDLLKALEWVQPNHILISDWNGYTWWINAINGQPTKAPETP